VDEKPELWSNLTKLKERGGPLFILFKGRLLLLHGYRLRGKLQAIIDWNKLERPLLPKPIFSVVTHEVETLGAEHLLNTLYESAPLEFNHDVSYGSELTEPQEPHKS
jgi:hypothetical protein